MRKFTIYPKSYVSASEKIGPYLPAYQTGYATVSSLDEIFDERGIVRKPDFILNNIAYSHSWRDGDPFCVNYSVHLLDDDGEIINFLGRYVVGNTYNNMQQMVKEAEKKAKKYRK